MASLLPRTAVARPPLPAKSNKLLLADEQHPVVKFQKIKKDEGLVIVGRVRVPTPVNEVSGGHAYVLRRYDTGFISATTMFRAAFPSFRTAEEKEEAAWIKSNFDLKPTGRDGFAERDHMKLAGLWVPVQLAAYLAPSYNLGYVVSALSEAMPDEDYAADSQYPITPLTKRRKAVPSTPTTSTNGTNGRLASPSKTPSGSPQKVSSNSKPVSSSKSRTSPAPSRSTPSRAVKGRKAVSPSPATQPTSATPGKKSGRHSTLAKTVEENEDDEAKPPFRDPAEDIAESQSLVQKLKEQQKVAGPVANAQKRTREEAEAPLALRIQEHDENAVPKEDRALIHPSRVANSWVPTLAPNQKSAVWGTLAFAIGWGATTYLPQVLPQFF